MFELVPWQFHSAIHTGYAINEIRAVCVDDYLVMFINDVYPPQPDESQWKGTVIEDGFVIEDGHPTFDKKWTEEMSAQEFAAELIKHTYREGWSLPDMPG